MSSSYLQDNISENLNASTFSTVSKSSRFPRRNNSTSTVQIRDTLQAPDNEAIISGVAHRLRSYIAKPTTIEDSIVEGAKKLKIRTSSELENSPPPLASSVLGPKSLEDAPTEGQVAAHLYNIFSTAQCSVDCTIVCLIYLERMIRITGLQLTCRNWRALTSTSMLLASKVWDDLSMVNADFATFLGYTLEQVNSWEKQFLAGMGYDVRVNASQYAKYYFDLRESTAERGDVPILEMQRAQRLELLSSVVQKRVDEMRMSSRKSVETRRAVSDQHRPGESDLPDAPAMIAHHPRSNVVLD